MTNIHSMGKMARERRAKKRKEQQRRTGYVRPSRAKPKTGWTLVELARMTAMRERLLKRWLEMEIVPRPPFRGVATRYGRQQLVWALAVRWMRAMDPVPLPTIKQRLTAMSGEQVEAIAREACPPGAAAEALGLGPAATPVAAGPNASGLDAELPAGGPGIARWTRFELGLGLELGIRDDASPEIRGLAARIRSLCA
jgi:hypothetical protein